MPTKQLTNREWLPGKHLNGLECSKARLVFRDDCSDIASGEILVPAEPSGKIFKCAFQDEYPSGRSSSHAHPQSKHVSSTPLLPVLCWHILEVSQHLFPLLPRKWGLGWGWSLSSSCHPSSSCCRYTCADKCKHVHVGTRAKNSNGTIMRTFSNFNILCGHCMLLPFPSFLPLLCHYALLFKF